MRVVAALGGNALSPPHGSGSVDEMAAALAETCRHLADLVAAGVDLVLTHGNGPQVGRILLQQEAAAPAVPPMPMDVCGAQSQGQIGYLLAQHLDNALRAGASTAPVLCLVTQVVVDGYDPAFRRPAKPVGPFFAEADAGGSRRDRLRHAQFGDGRWRRVVASPLPVRFVEEAAVLQTIAAGHIVVAAAAAACRWSRRTACSAASRRSWTRTCPPPGSPTSSTPTCC
jgi:carbamate kinase